MTKYKNAPLKYVLFVADLSPASVLGQAEALDRIFDALRDVLQVREDALVPDDPFSGPSGGSRFVNNERRRAVSVGPARITVDTTSYSTFTEFSSFLEHVLAAIADVAPGRACQRLGLRYVDEIRIPDSRPGDISQWRNWIAPDLFPAFVFEGAPVAGRREVAGAVDDSHEDGFGVRFAWRTGEGYAVHPDGPLQVPGAPPPGPFLSLDTDSYWRSLPGTDVLGLGDPLLIERIRRLHTPVQNYFESHLTDRIRREIFMPVTKEQDV